MQRLRRNRSHVQKSIAVSDKTRRGIRSAQLGLLVNTLLAVAKFIAGVAGTSYALIADAIESTTDILSSLIVWSGLRVASRDPDEEYPFGYGKAESIATAAVALMLLFAAALIAIESIREIVTPHHTPKAWTLAVLVGVILIKAFMSWRTHGVGNDIGSSAVMADAWHHLSDAITSGAAFIGISIALVGGGAYRSADDWAALFASGVIAYNGFAILRRTIHDLMDRTAGEEILEPICRAALGVPDVLAIEKLAVRRSGMIFRATLHVQTWPRMPLDEAHVVSGKVKSAIRDAVPQVQYVLVHMEPYEGTADTPNPAADRQR